MEYLIFHKEFPFLLLFHVNENGFEILQLGGDIARFIFPLQGFPPFPIFKVLCLGFFLILYMIIEIPGKTRSSPGVIACV